MPLDLEFRSLIGTVAVDVIGDADLPAHKTESPEHKEAIRCAAIISAYLIALFREASARWVWASMNNILNRPTDARRGSVKNGDGPS